MDRRDFLKVLGVASVAPVVVAKAMEPKPEMMEFRKYAKLPMAHTPLVEGEVPTWRKLNVFDPQKSYGDFITISDIVDLEDPDDPVMFEAGKLLDEQIAELIPDGYRNRIHYVTTYGGHSADPLSQITTVGWKYSPPKPMTATRAMMEDRERLFFGSNRSGKTYAAQENHLMDSLRYGMRRGKLNWDV